MKEPRKIDEPVTEQDLLDLRACFDPKYIQWRTLQRGQSQGGKWYVKVLAYVDSRAIQDRLDKTLGPWNWTTAIRPVEGGVVCELSIKVNGEWITKTDGASYTDIEAFKGGISSALRRAAVHWGIGRYLYDLGESFGAEIRESAPPTPERYAPWWHQESEGKGRDRKTLFYWHDPMLPNKYLPDGAHYPWE